MSRNYSKQLLVVFVALFVCACAVLAWRVYLSDAEASPLITDTELTKALHSQVLKSDYRILTQNDRWNNDRGAGTFQRTLECTVMRVDNGPVDMGSVSESLENWIGQIVSIDAAFDVEESTDELSRILRYRNKAIAGELKYSIKSVLDATLVVDNMESSSTHRPLTIQIVEQTNPSGGNME